jgi:hypothetical protein
MGWNEHLLALMHGSRRAWLARSPAQSRLVTPLLNALFGVYSAFVVAELAVIWGNSRLAADGMRRPD